ncbi:ATP synthase F0 subcomplex A subunit [Actinomadura pelletieri DSM 43383]|uniref:ATP synthase subunit a n=1 Tax=Actinomadura pelletieri DSM 43383 TaxID=1120940 RepID=A0A495QTG7_9ACTN|nr:F0F1 ATP synthase subunit A [Actinomadura pelletieri]RKS76759.1 ATP synthase F0 subcomplex A subunit [Actinomadura pelletieri DSM 43383]
MNAQTVLASSGEEFKAPGPELFEFPPLFAGGPEWLTKPVVFAVFGSLVVVVFFWSAFANPKLVPRGVQNIGEVGYMFVRDQIGRPFLGKNTDQWMPLLMSVFFLIWVWNIFAVVPIIQFPIASHIAFPAVLAASIYIIKIYLGIKHQGPVKYFTNMIPPGLPLPVYFLLVPIEYLSTFILAPFTHAVRLFANMFAGHTILAFFSLVGFWFLFEKPTVAGFSVGIIGVLVTIVMTAFELLIQFLQAFLFTMLAAMYIQSGLHAEH